MDCRTCRTLNQPGARFCMNCGASINPDGSNLVRLTNHSERNYARDPAWSPDKRKIAFSDDDGDIYVMTADGTGLTRLTERQELNGG